MNEPINYDYGEIYNFGKIKIFQSFGEKEIPPLNELFPNLSLIETNQVHENYIHNIDSEYEKGKLISLSDGDGLTTTFENQALIIKTADCLPIIIFSEKNNRIFALHAGWRGLAKEIILKISKFLDPNDFNQYTAFIGPHIRTKNYEVSKDLLLYFNKWSKKISSDLGDKNKCLLNLTQIASLQLNHLGISRTIVHSSDTYDNSNLVSYRRGNKPKKRNITVVFRSQD